MYYAAYPTKIVLTLCRLFLHAFDVCGVCQSVSHADGVHILLRSYIDIVELATDAAVDLFVAFLL